MRRGDELVDANRVDAVARQVGAPADAHAVGERLLARVAVDHHEPPRPGVVRRGREARGLDQPVEERAVDRIGPERADRTPLLDERRNAVGHRNRSSCGGRMS